LILDTIDIFDPDDMIASDGRMLSAFPLHYGASSIGMELAGDHEGNGNNSRCHSLKKELFETLSAPVGHFATKKTTRNSCGDLGDE
jgi:hypothetical protein